MRFELKGGLKALAIHPPVVHGFALEPRKRDVADACASGIRDTGKAGDYVGIGGGDIDRTAGRIRSDKVDLSRCGGDARNAAEAHFALDRFHLINIGTHVAQVGTGGAAARTVVRLKAEVGTGISRFEGVECRRRRTEPTLARESWVPRDVVVICPGTTIGPPCGDLRR